MGCTNAKPGQVEDDDKSRTSKKEDKVDASDVTVDDLPPEEVWKYTRPEFHEVGKPFLRVILPRAVATQLRDTQKDKGIRVVLINETPELAWVGCDISSDDQGALLKAMNDAMGSILAEEKKLVEEQAAKAKALADKKAAEAKEREEKKAMKKSKSKGNLSPRGSDGDELKRPSDAEPQDDGPTRSPSEMDLKPGELEKMKEEPAGLPKATLKCESHVHIASKFKPKVPLQFEWIDMPTPYSHFNDPYAENWENTGNGLRQAVGKPGVVYLEWRRGMKGKWTRLEAKDNKVFFEYEAAVAGSSKEYRGFQCRWIIDGRRYLTPLELAPTLIYKLLKYNVVKTALEKLPKEERQIKNIPDARLRKALISLENILPMNTWDIDIDVEKRRGAYYDGQLLISTYDKLKQKAHEKMHDPKLLAQARRAMLKAPIQVVTSLLGAVGIDIAAIIPDMDFFMPPAEEPDFEALAKAEQDPEELDDIRRDKEREVNQGAPEWLGGIRLSIPPSRDLANALKCRRPHVPNDVEVPVHFHHEWSNKADAAAAHTVQVKYWPVVDGVPHYGHAVTVDCKTPHKKGLLNSEEGTMIKPGTYGYKWIIDGKPYLNNGHPIEKGDENGRSYHLLVVKCSAIFGLGIIV